MAYKNRLVFFRVVNWIVVMIPRALILALLCDGGFHVQVLAASHQHEADAKSKGASSQNSTPSWQQLHSSAVDALLKGKSLDDAVPAEIRWNLVSRVDADLRGTGTAASIKEGITYRDILEGSENHLRKAGQKSHVLISSAPDQCRIRYQPAIGGPILDAGFTTVKADLDPRFYVFTCDCHPSVKPQMVDCSQDKQFRFMCPEDIHSPVKK